MMALKKIDASDNQLTYSLSYELSYLTPYECDLRFKQKIVFINMGAHILGKGALKSGPGRHLAP